jgi:hypothetical protein
LVGWPGKPPPPRCDLLFEFIRNSLSLTLEDLEGLVCHCQSSQDGADNFLKFAWRKRLLAVGLKDAVLHILGVGCIFQRSGSEELGLRSWEG